MLQRRSVLTVEELTVRQARELLTEWAAINASRDDRIRTAYHSGVSKSDIARLSGIARTTVDRILDEPDGSQTEHDLEEAP
jgi:DNA invertase Pin-like site-specific DNA recombinase